MVDPTPRPVDPLQNGRILVVDPSPVSLIAIAGVLDHSGFECVCARTHQAALKAVESQAQDLVVCDVGDDAPAALAMLGTIRSQVENGVLSAVLIADARWNGLQQKTEPMESVHCLFKPIDPKSLLAIVEHAMWMPHLVQTHRRRGSRPNRPGWVTLD